MSTNNYVQIRELRRQRIIVRRFKNWERWKLMFPFVAIVVIYAMSKFGALGNELVSAFGHGDLLLFSALVLIELSIESTHINEELEREAPDKIERLIENSRFFGVLLIFVYGAMKLMVLHGSKLNHIAPPRAKAFSFFSLSLTFFVVSFSIFAFWKTLSNVVESDDSVST